MFFMSLHGFITKKKTNKQKNQAYQTRKKICVVNHLRCDFKDGRQRVPFRVHNFVVFEFNILLYFMDLSKEVEL